MKKLWNLGMFRIVLAITVQNIFYLEIYQNKFFFIF